jgi:hypothetical protein
VIALFCGALYYLGRREEKAAQRRAELGWKLVGDGKVKVSKGDRPGELALRNNSDRKLSGVELTVEVRYDGGDTSTKDLLWQDWLPGETKVVRFPEDRQFVRVNLRGSIARVDDEKLPEKAEFDVGRDW